MKTLTWEAIWMTQPKLTEFDDNYLASLFETLLVQAEDASVFEVWFKYMQVRESESKNCVNWVDFRADYYLKEFQLTKINITTFEQKYKKAYGPERLVVPATFRNMMPP